MNGIKQKINKKSLIATVVWYLKLCTTFAMVSFPVSLFQQDAKLRPMIVGKLNLMIRQRRC